MKKSTRLLVALGGAMGIVTGAHAALVTSGDLVVDVRSTDLSAGSAAWANHATDAGAVGDFATIGGGNANVVAVGGVDALYVNGDSANAMFSASQTPLSLQGNSSRSVEAWVWCDAFASGQTAVGWGLSSPNGSFSEFRFDDSTANGMWSGWYIDSGWDLDPESALGEWVHVAWTYDGSTMTGYLNGQYVDSKDLTGEGNYPLITAASYLDIGGGPYGDGGSTSVREAFGGYIADARVHTGALSAADVTNNFNEGMYAIPEPATLGLVGLFGGGILFIRRRFAL